MVLSPGAAAWDYVVFVLFVLVSTCLPLWSKLSKPTSKAEFVFATSGGVGMLSMMLSIARGTLGVRSFLGYPSELYYRGSAMWETLYGMVCAYPVVIFVFVPVYYSLGITSVYQYLDLRFNSQTVRCLASATFIWRQLLNLGITVFTPCVALNTVIGVPYWASIVGIVFISCCFTLLGGLKAAIKADVIQTVTVILISLAIIVQGCVKVGGVKPVITDNADNGRLKFFDFKWDATARVDTLSAWLGQLFISLSQFGCQQNFVQRYCSLSSEKKVQKTLLCNIPMIVVLFSLSWLIGMVIYSVYKDCDPMTSGYTRKMDEILPFFVEDQFMYMPGLMGLFLGSLFNGALSLLVSNVNSLATVTWEDFVKRTPAFRNLKDRQELTVIKIIGAIYGVVIMGISFAVSQLSGVIEGSMLVMSATSGPLLGVFLLALLVPCANRKGAAAGIVVSHLVMFWMSIGHLMYSPNKDEMLPLSVEGCTNTTFALGIDKTEAQWPMTSVPREINLNISSYLHVQQHVSQANATSAESPSPVYAITYMYYAFIGTIICVIVGVIISLIFGSDDSDVYDEKLLHPAALKLSKMFSGKPRTYLKEKESIKQYVIKSSMTDDKMIQIEDGLSRDNLGFANNEDHRTFSNVDLPVTNIDVKKEITDVKISEDVTKYKPKSFNCNENINLGNNEDENDTKVKVDVTTRGENSTESDTNEVTAVEENEKELNTDTTIENFIAKNDSQSREQSFKRRNRKNDEEHLRY